MKEFGPDGRFKHIRHDARRALFSDLVKIINDNKSATIAATLSTDQYRRNYSGVFGSGQMVVYGLCFILLVNLQAKRLPNNYREKIPFIMDRGNRYRHHVVDAHSYIQNHFQPLHFMNAGGLAFDTDKEVRALQAADLVAWSVRRRLTGKFNNGFETLVDVFNSPHIEQPFEEEWMKEVAAKLRAIRRKK